MTESSPVSNPQAPSTDTVTLYTRTDCSLCDDAAAMLDALAGELSFGVEIVDIDADAALRERYNDIIPVIAFAGRELARAPIGSAALRRALTQALAPR